MKKPIIFILILLILIGWIAAPVNFNTTDTSFEYTIASAQGNIVTTANAASKTKADEPTKIDFLFTDIDISKLFAIIGNALLGFFGIFTWLAGILLNFAVSKEVVEMGATVQSITGIEVAWRALRDLANIVLIFALLAIGIATILRVESYGARRLLATLIVVALLVNFSLFFTGVIIDVSNALATVIFNSLPVVACDAASVDCAGEGISNIVMNNLHLSSLFNLNTATGNIDVQQIDSTLSVGKIFLLTFLGSIFLLLTAFVFFAAAILLSVRFVVLIILMIFSPLAFVGMILPATQSYARKWWTTLFNQSFFAPLFLLMVWISITLYDSGLGSSLGVDSNTAATYANIANGNDSSAVIVLNFMIIMIFMVASLVIAKQLGAYGSSTVMAWGKSARRMGQGFIRGRAGSVGSRTFGTAAAGLGRQLDRTSARLGQSTAGKGVRLAANLATLGVGRKAVKTVEQSRFGGSESRPERKERRRKRNFELDNTQLGNEARRKARLTKKGRATPEETAAISKMSQTILEDLGAKRLADPNFAQHMSVEQLEGVQKSDKFTQQQKDAITNARFTKLNQALAGGDNEEVRKELRSLSDKEVEMLGTNTLRRPEIMRGISQSQIEAVQKSGKINSETKKHIKDGRKAHLQEAIEGGTIGDEIASMSPKNIAKIDRELLIQPNMSQHYTPTVLIELSKEMNVGDRQAIKTEIQRAVDASTATQAQKDSHAWLNNNASPAGVIF